MATLSKKKDWPRPPGVRFECEDASPRAVVPVRTDIAGFVGVAQTGTCNTAIRIESFAQFTAEFGAHFDQGYLAYALDGFFANGGRTCYVVRVGDDDAYALARLKPLHFTRGLQALETIDQVSVVAMPDLVWIDAQPRSGRPKPIRCDAAPTAQPPALARNAVDQRAPLAQADRDELRAALMRHCEKMRDRFALIDADPAVDAARVELQAASPRSMYAALYYPWLLVADPLQEPGAVRAVPPSGHVAGVYARVDLAIGVQKAPANERLIEVEGVEREFSDADLTGLNEARVNVIRPLPGRGIRIYGARTLARAEDLDWKYVNVRRLLLMIEAAIDRQTQWAVWEPNNQQQQRALARVVRSFLDKLWRAGVLDGASADEAYFVVCDESTNPPDQIDMGRLTCQIGVLPPAPAEFIVVRIGKSDGTPAAAALPGGDDA